MTKSPCRTIQTEFWNAPTQKKLLKRLDMPNFLSGRVIRIKRTNLFRYQGFWTFCSRDRHANFRPPHKPACFFSVLSFFFLICCYFFSLHSSFLYLHSCLVCFVVVVWCVYVFFFLTHFLARAWVQLPEMFVQAAFKVKKKEFIW